MSTQEKGRSRPDNVTLIAIYHFIGAALGLIGALALMVFAMLPVLFYVREPRAVGWSLLAIGIGAIAAGVFGIVDLVVGLGLLQMRKWARWAAMALAVLGLGGFPVGTVIGVLILVYLLGDDGRQAFEGK